MEGHDPFSVLDEKGQHSIFFMSSYVNARDPSKQYSMDLFSVKILITL